ncbi:hypothetical protein [Lutibacter sp.]|uniref:hypothetical protein n=1 Tax=Lutibacter sp. TaxID=1925666 RepID=UPI0035644888
MFINFFLNLDYYNLDLKLLITFLIGFFIVAIAANQIAKVFQKIKFPLITGLIITGIITGSSFLNFIIPAYLERLNFLNELRSRVKNIKWMTIGQLFITFFMSSTVIYSIASYIPFMKQMEYTHKVAVAILDDGQDSMDLEIRNEDIHGIRLRNLRLLPDVLVLSVKRKGQLLVSLGYTRLRLGNIITLVGTITSLEKLKFKFDT